MMDEQFRWSEDDSIVVRTQMAIAVYLNQFDDLVIRQEGQYPDEDVWIVIAPANVERVIAAMRSTMAGADVQPINQPECAATAREPEQVGNDLPLLKAVE